MDKKVAMLTTTDNPYSPFTDFDKWFAFDTTKGYNTCGLLDRLAHTSEGLPDAINDEIIHEAMLEIINIDPYGVHVIVYGDE